MYALVRALCAVKLTASGRTCASLAAPVSLPESDTTEVAERRWGIAGFEPALTAPETPVRQACDLGKRLDGQGAGVHLGCRHAVWRLSVNW
jgi:hypothetical protein